jgi:PmbA protein
MKKTATSAENSNFAYTQEQFQQWAELALELASQAGATDASVDVSEGVGLSVSVRKGSLESVEHNQDKSLGISVHVGQRRGHASTSDFSAEAIERTVNAAYDIARFTAEDPCADLPDAADIATPEQARRDLDLFHPWAIEAQEATELALRCEEAAFIDRRITNSDGASVSAQQSHFYLAHSQGFGGGYASSRHSLSVAPIASFKREMQRDHWYTSERSANDLADPEAVGRYAAQRALSRLKARKIKTCEVPVLFESTLAVGLLGSFVHAVSGGALYRQSSFLLNSLGLTVWAPHIEIDEDPHVLRGKASGMFDDEGVATKQRKVVQLGVVEGYFLSSYSGRKLGMKTTGHAGGAHNLVMRSRLTQPGDDLAAMLKKLGTGLFVIELMGQGVNYVTGDYSRGAAGFWVENGEIAYPVHEITIAGNLKDMYTQVVAIGADAYTYGGKTTGSLLLEKMKVAGL